MATKVMTPETIADDLRFNAYRIEESLQKYKPHFSGRLVTRRIVDLPAGEVLIKAHYSSLNYKDALSAYGNKSVTRQYPHTPGIDIAGEVVHSDSETFAVGDLVLVTGYDLGMNTDGGFSEYVRVPATWVVPLPSPLTPHQSMILGTAGFTAALCVEKLLLNGLAPDQGEVLVSGASGGVGAVAVALLAQLGFSVTACTGKTDQRAFLSSLGATSIIERHTLQEPSSRPVLKERWAGAVDVAGGEILLNILKSLRYGGSVACCGLVGSPTFNASVFPFILRGVNLLGVDSVNLGLATKTTLWNKLATEWRLPMIDSLGVTIRFSELEDYLQQLIEGRTVGRVVLDLITTP